MPWIRRSRPIRLIRTSWCRTCSRCRRCRSSPTSPTCSIRRRASTPTRPTATWKCRRRWSISTPPPAQTFQINAALRMQGGVGRDVGFEKHSFRFVFKAPYGPSKLDFPLFGDGATDSFDTITLRANFNDAWVWGQNEAQYIRDQFADETLLAMGEPASHGNYVQLYVNGLYWGVYNPTERPDTSFAAAYLGGNKDNWDAFERRRGGQQQRHDRVQRTDELQFPERQHGRLPAGPGQQSGRHPQSELSGPDGHEQLRRLHADELLHRQYRLAVATTGTWPARKTVRPPRWTARASSSSRGTRRWRRACNGPTIRTST